MYLDFEIVKFCCHAHDICFREQKLHLALYIQSGRKYLFHWHLARLLNHDGSSDRDDMLKQGTFLELDSKKEQSHDVAVASWKHLLTSPKSYFQSMFQSNPNAKELIQEVIEELGNVPDGESIKDYYDL